MLVELTVVDAVFGGIGIFIVGSIFGWLAGRVIDRWVDNAGLTDVLG